ncbi:MAG: exodeoxyribonuclease III [Pyrinomonadaceae bacterium]
MKIATWNINGINSRLQQVVDWCENNQPDVVCLQETKCVDNKFPHRQLRSVGFQDVAFHGEKAYNGVAILSKYPIRDLQKNFPGDDDSVATRLISATINDIRIVNVYVPHGTALGTDKFAFKLDWFRRLRIYFDENFDRDENVVLCGDLNVAPHELDVWKPSLWKDKMHFTKPEREAIQNVKKWGFVDVFRQINDDVREYTWWDLFRPSSFERDRGLRIDHIWASPPLAEQCADCWIDKEPRALEKPSDHAPVVADFIV